MARPDDLALVYRFDCDNDGIWDIDQLFNSAQCTFTIAGDHTVNGGVDDNRMGFSLEASTVVTVLQPMPTSKDDCKGNLWKQHGVFKNQGDCVSSVATKGKNGPVG